MTDKTVLEKVIEIFSTMTEENAITKDSEIVGDLGLSSMDLMFLISSLEDEFGIKVSEKQIRKMVTVEDVVDVIASLQ